MTTTAGARGAGAGPFTIGVLSPVVGGFYFGKLLSGIARAARSGGHQVVAIQTYAADLDRERFPDRSRVEVPAGMDALDGFIVITSAVDRDTLRELDASAKPLVVVSEHEAGLRAPVVTPDNRGGLRAAVEHLVSHGHTRIGFLGNPQQLDIRERYEAYRSAMQANGIETQDSWILTTSDNQEVSGSAAATELLERGMPTTATIAATDRNALGFMRMLRTRGLSVPADHAVIGFDHSDNGARARPRLSSVDPHHDRVGELAVTLLLAQLSGQDVGAGTHLSQTTLVARESCGCLTSAHAGLLVDGSGSRAPLPSGSAAAQLSELTRAVFLGSGAERPASLDARSWVRTIVELMVTAAQRAVVPPSVVLNRLADATAALNPHPEALEQLLVVLRALETEAGAELPPASPSHASALRSAVTGITVALTKGCTRALLARSGGLEQTLITQYEIDLELMRPGGASPRTLSWLPSAHRGPASLALWTGRRTPSGDRQLEVVGTRDVGATGSRLAGMSFSEREFPPAALTRAAGSARPDLTFVIPVTYADSDWGYLTIGGPVDTRSTSSRDKYNHWAAMLAVALDHERMVGSLREQRTALQVAAERERRLADDFRASEERYMLAAGAVSDGVWDWDVLSGAVYFSPRWKSALGYAEADIGSTLEEWTGRVHPDDRDELSMAIAAQLAGVDEPFTLEQRVLDASGTYRWMLCRAVTVLNEAGSPARLVGAMTDLTESSLREGAGRTVIG
ncbi:substrate-binding domain-containing protein [Sanguibacter suarezii]|uniref:substrate-binding domain-containing protein n=1 Tax=Sanguibacter suarezii TaxID=60921 RepID=UPI000832BB4F|nr:substrate-binding domain-containing protein [Sanguibacter suarezii]